MTYKLDSDLRKLQSPVVLVIDGVETEYPNGEALTELVFEKRYLIETIRANGDRIVVALEESEAFPTEPEDGAGFF